MDSQSIYNLLRADGSIVTNKNLVFGIGHNEAEIFSELISRYSYFETREELGPDKSFFNTVNDLYLGTGIGERAQRTAIKNLVSLGLIKTYNKGTPPIRYFIINFDIELLDKYLKKGIEKIDKLKKEYGIKNAASLDKYKELRSQDLKTASEGFKNCNSRVNNTKKNTKQNTKYYTNVSVNRYNEF